MNEGSRVESQSDWYLKEQLDFDRRMIGFRYQTLKPHIKGPEGLELGPAEGEMTQFLVADFSNLTVVDGSSELLSQIPDRTNLKKVHSLFEEFEPSQKFNTIIMEHILEHVDDPVALLTKAKGWLWAGGKVLIGVPNANSIHRLVAVKMGLLTVPSELNSRDYALGHRRVYAPETLALDIKQAGYNIDEMGGVFFKPLSNSQIQENWNEDMIQGFYNLGKDFPENAAELYAVCSLD
jgi:2-polyprenyl-3-methyl-5-hydroxy-6-metoxy-1,4-benzoquinol methylase